MLLGVAPNTNIRASAQLTCLYNAARQLRRPASQTDAEVAQRLIGAEDSLTAQRCELGGVHHAVEPRDAFAIKLQESSEDEAVGQETEHTRLRRPSRLTMG